MLSGEFQDFKQLASH